MSAVTKRKYVFQEMLDDFSMPRPHQTIVQILGNHGSNLHEVLTPDGIKFLASLPVHFRKNIWIKRGDFVVVEPIAEGDKVKAEIVRVLYRQHIKAIKKSNLWPEYFDSSKKDDNNYDSNNGGACDAENLSESKQNNRDSSVESDYESEDGLSDIEPNTNRPVEIEPSSDEESSDEN